MTTNQELRKAMAKAVGDLTAKKITVAEAMAICRAGAVVVGSLRVELEYRKARTERPKIDFIGGR